MSPLATREAGSVTVLWTVSKTMHLNKVMADSCKGQAGAQGEQRGCLAPESQEGQTLTACMSHPQVFTMKPQLSGANN